ncbi:MAG: galactokinase [Actinomycetes bacterium]
MSVRATAPGRVNLIGDHTDYMGGPVLPMAVHLGTTVSGDRVAGRIDLTSNADPTPLHLDLPVADPTSVDPTWGRYVAGAARALANDVGLSGIVSSDVPVGSGLSSSSALTVAVLLALGATGSPADVALMAQAAEISANGVPCGVMDQLASTSGVAGHALLIRCDSLEVHPVPIPEAAAIWVVPSGQQRELATSDYSLRRAQCESAAAILGPLPSADLDSIEALDDPVVRARARHVRTESDRVSAGAEALRCGDLVEFGRLMVASHRSLATDFEVSTPVLDAVVAELLTTPGVYGARLTGAGFGGCFVALARPGVELDGWHVRPAAGATVSA